MKKHPGNTYGRCPRSRCGGVMKRGVAFENSWEGMADFPGDEYACTISQTGPAKIVPCVKCKRCGFSVSLVPMPMRVRAT